MASITKTAHGGYRVRYRDLAGKSRSRTVKRLDQAKALAAALETDKARGEFADPALGRRKFELWAGEWLDTLGEKAPRTRENYDKALRCHVLPYFGGIAVARIDRALARQFVASMSDAGFHPNTTAASVKVLRLVMEYAVDAGAIRANPVTRLGLKKPPRRDFVFLNPDEIERLATAIDVPQFGVLVRFAAYTGLRAGEIGALRRKRLNLGAGTVEVAESLAELADGSLSFGPTKTYQRRIVPMPPTVTAMMAELAEGLGPDDLVFRSSSGGPLRHRNFYSRHYRPAVKKAGIDTRMRFHDLRHTCAALLISLGAHPRAIMERLGHSSITITLDVYGHMFPQLDAALTDRLEALLSGESAAA